MTDIELKSAAFRDHDVIPRRHAKAGENISPPLSWSGVPEEAVELALVCEDPDAPSGTFVHWLVTGIDPRSEGLDADEQLSGSQPHRNGFGERGWGGPQPPVGDDAHRYFFRLYALPAPVSLPDDATADDVHSVLDRQQLASGTLVGLYQR
ncbi:YbhB/YbcL family Raf kinase inhibitor-like protein [Streptomyces sporangiiformans]|uniref:YbhB/YbcL family Raf kinase inhibitor-like protein n=1 Tax=Streptomyces sporangiiformans TaxID=2315329 RepID=A0A505DQW3_9ACTN|nr:YbhB/YbcL family Raf kinase inhibitor-like protein [Streptomyces sporangiiformans]TPQ23600.1 YbhB/YbcL family Raf kinase inhibitor-like protein [Streptomyces sporangiiformans]